ALLGLLQVQQGLVVFGKNQAAHTLILMDDCCPSMGVGCKNTHNFCFCLSLNAIFRTASEKIATLGKIKNKFCFCSHLTLSLSPGSAIP
ncbi:MAG: hypothetical protein PHE04_08180, partial [Bacteroidales bacterium]|nr:hypothetical protein [Bacteroidales bacterium]